MRRVGDRRVWSVAEVTGAIARRFEDIPPLWVEGEIQDLRARAGQIYFALSDEHRLAASMNAIVFDRLVPRPGDGERVHVYGRPQFWPPRGEVSLRVEIIERVGEGALRAEIVRLRRLLEAEGLLEEARKRPLPALPEVVGLVTSAAGAAREDVLRNLWQRFPRAAVVAVDVPVQGESAPEAIAAGLEVVAGRADVVVLTRGGGSLEDLMAFNTEVVARAIVACPIPVVAAIGHERDTTIADLVADLRVSTPTAAAGAVVPDERALREHLARAERVLHQGLVGRSVMARERVARDRRVLARALRQHAVRASDRRSAAERRLGAALGPVADRASTALTQAERGLGNAVDAELERGRRRLAHAEAVLGALSPAATISRGYAVVRDPQGRVITTGERLVAGDDLAIQLRDGSVPVTVRDP